jgi:hypothetical protein
MVFTIIQGRAQSELKGRNARSPQPATDCGLRSPAAIQFYPRVILLRANSNPPTPALRSSTVEGSGTGAEPSGVVVPAYNSGSPFRLFGSVK